MIEIERRWLVATLPDPLPVGERLQQAYLMTTPAGVRVRAASGGYTLTIKTPLPNSDGGVARIEIERALDEDEFAALWAVATALRIDKHRYLIEIPGGVAELDVFHGRLEGCRLVEVEFDTLDDAAAFQQPHWFGPEVTDDPAYTNAALSQYGWPERDVDSTRR